MTTLSTRLRTLAAEPAPKGTHKSIRDFVSWRIGRWAAFWDLAHEPDAKVGFDAVAEIGAAVRASLTDTWERGQYKRALALCEACAAAPKETT